MTEPTPPGGPTPAPGADSAAPPRRPRGRPFKKRDAAAVPPAGANGAPVPPADGAAAAPGADAPAPRRRRTKQIDKAALAKQLQGLHVMAAKITGIGFIQIDDMEASMLADSIENVAREYDLELSGKTGAFIQLIGCAAIVYGPRVIMFRALQKQARERAEAEAVAAAATAEKVIPSAAPVNGASGRLGT